MVIGSETIVIVWIMERLSSLSISWSLSMHVWAHFYCISALMTQLSVFVNLTLDDIATDRSCQGSIRISYTHVSNYD